MEFEIYNEVEAIQPLFDQVIAYSQRYDTEYFNTDELFEKWACNKNQLYAAFGNRLIYEYPEEIEFHLDNNSKETRLRSFIQYVFDMQYVELGRFLNNNVKCFYNNLIESDYCTDDGLVIKKGTKLIKSFKYFIKDQKTLEMLQNKASMMLQEDKVCGKLCISIHPLDYLSMSENTYNWRSCHALDGCFRAGNLSYMADNCTLVCYLKSNEDCKLPNFPPEVPWNNKKWRVLLYLSNDWNMIFASRQYPFDAPQGLSKIRELFLNNINNQAVEYSNWSSEKSRYVWSDWSNYRISEMPVGATSYSLDDSYYLVGGGLKALSQLVVNKEGSNHYNDVLTSPHYQEPYYTILTEHWVNFGGHLREFPTTKSHRTVFTVGEKFSCIHCHNNPVGRCQDTFMCDECELEYGHSDNGTFTTCAECGARLYTDDAFYYEDTNTHYCEECWRNMEIECACCGKRIIRYEAEYDEWNDRYICGECYEGDDYDS